MSDKTQVSTAPVIIGVLITGLGFLAFSFFGAAPSVSSSEYSLEWFGEPKLELTAEEVAANRKSYKPLQYLPSASSETIETRQAELLAAYREANAFSFTPLEEVQKAEEAAKQRTDCKDTGKSCDDDSAAAPTATQISQKIAIRSDEVLEIIAEFDEYVHLGEPLFRACHNAMNTLADQLKSGDLSLTNGNLNDDVLNSDTTLSYRESCGNALPILVEYGLLKEGIGWTSDAAPLIFGSLQRRRFLDPVILRVPPSSGLAPADRYLIAWWRTMMPDAFTPQMRQQFLTDLTPLAPPLNDPKSKFYFDLNRARASIAFATKGKEGIVDVYESVCKPSHGNDGSGGEESKICRWFEFNEL